MLCDGMCACSGPEMHRTTMQLIECFYRSFAFVIDWFSFRIFPLVSIRIQNGIDATYVYGRP